MSSGQRVDGQLLRVCDDDQNGQFEFSPEWAPKGYTLAMEKLCVLNFVKECKYTISENYFPNLPDGEVILSKDYGNEDKPRYFWVTCEEDGNFWITPIHNGPEIYVGTTLITGTRPLEFGSWVGVYYRETGVVITYRFVRRFDFIASDKDLGPANMIEELLRKMVDPFKLQDKKSWKMVSKLWDKNYADDVAKNSVVFVDLENGPSNLLFQLACDLEGATNFKMQNMRLLVPPLPVFVNDDDDEDKKKDNRSMLLKNNILRFFDSPLVYSLKKLEIIFLNEGLAYYEHFITNLAILKIKRRGTVLIVKYGDGYTYL